MPSEFSMSSDSVDVEQIMDRIRARIREKRGVDYTDDEIQELANVKIEQFLDPSKVRSELLALYLKGRNTGGAAAEGATREPLLKRLRGIPRAILRALKRRLRKLFVNEHIEQLNYALFHNLVVELTRVGIEVKNLKMRVESLSSRLDFNERRARAMENAVQYKAGAGPAAEPARSTGGWSGPSSRRDGGQRHQQGRPRGGDAQQRGSQTQLPAADAQPEVNGAQPAVNGAQPAAASDSQSAGSAAVPDGSDLQPRGGEAQRRRRRRRRGRGGSAGEQTQADGAGRLPLDSAADTAADTTANTTSETASDTVADVSSPDRASDHDPTAQ